MARTEAVCEVVVVGPAVDVEAVDVEAWRVPGLGEVPDVGERKGAEREKKRK